MPESSGIWLCRQRRADLQTALLAPEAESLLTADAVEEGFREHIPLPLSEADKNLSIELSGSHDPVENVAEREGVLTMSPGENIGLDSRRDRHSPAAEPGARCRV